MRMLLRKRTYQISLAAIVFAVGSLLAVSAALAQTLPEDPNAGNFIGSVLESESADKTGEDAVNSGAALENKAKGSFESSYEQVLFSLAVLLLLIIVLLRYVYRFRIRKKKYIGDKDDTSL